MKKGHNIKHTENQKAYLTHYLHNKKDHKVSAYYEEAVLAGAKDGVAELLGQYELFNKNIPFPAVKNPKYTFIDLFAGVGGFRLAFQNLKCKCVFSCEIDIPAQESYYANYGEYPFPDITDKHVKASVPVHDILTGGFPCQAFSIAGKRKGFEDTRGTLFYHVAEILKEKKPKAFFLENVKGLMNHDKGETLDVILNVLRKDLNYYVPDPQIVNARNFGVPQNRERVYIIGFRKDLGVDTFEYPKPLPAVPLTKILEKKVVSAKYYLSTQYLKTLKAHKARHASKGNGFGYEILKDDGVANAIVVGGMGRERNLIIDKKLKDFTPVTKIRGTVNREGLRRLTPREWARLQGFPDNFIIKVSDAQAYKQFGNSVAVPAIQATANCILEALAYAEKQKNK